ncbi:MAG: glycosyltransferase [Coleofasciculus sp. F4-SAH-05]
MSILHLENIKLSIKENPNKIPVIVISYNNGSYVENIINQLQKFGIKPIIFDNCSDDNNTLYLLRKIRETQKASVIFLPKNFGHYVGFIKEIYDLLPEVFGYTDPDLQFSSNLPPNFIDVLAELTVNYSVYKAGFALSIDA